MINIDLIKDRLTKEYEATADRVDLLYDEDRASAEYERGRFEALGDALALLDGIDSTGRIDARL
jgi:hypothetical protein